MDRMNEKDLKDRTKKFALETIRFVESFPKNVITDVLGKQLLRAATSVGANYRSACRAKSKADFAAKLAIVEEEADEAAYWLELLVDGRYVSKTTTDPLIIEANSLVAITVSSLKTLRSASSNSKIQNLKSKIGTRGVTQVDKGDRL